MSLNISLELYFICKAILFGVLLRFIYDLFRISRRVFRRNAAIVAVEDTVYWIMAGLSVFVLMYDFNGGSIRIHAFIIVALGMLLYGVSLSPFIVKYISLILLKIKFVIAKLLKKVVKKVKIKRKSALEKKAKKREKLKKKKKDKDAKKMSKRAAARRKKSNKMSVFLIGFLMMIFCGVMVIQISDMREEQHKLKIQEEHLKAELKQQEDRTDELQEQKVYVQTKQYVEEKAKEFGYVYPDEIILKPEK